MSSIFSDHNAVRLDVNSRKKTIKFLKGNIGLKFHNFGSGNNNLGYYIKGISNKRKNKQMELNEIKKFLYMKRQYQQSKKATQRLRVNISKSYIWD